MKLIDKSALVAEIERQKDEYLKHSRNKFHAEWSCGTLDNILSFINTLEVKEVDLEHEVESYWKQCDMTWCRDAYSMTHIRSMLSEITKHFYELGLKVQKGEEV